MTKAGLVEMAGPATFRWTELLGCLAFVSLRLRNVRVISPQRRSVTTLGSRYRDEF